MEVPRTQQLERIISLYGRTYREGYDELKRVEAAVQADIARCREQLPPEALEPQVEPLMGVVQKDELVRDVSLAVLRALGKPTHKQWSASSEGWRMGGANVNFGDIPLEAREVIDRLAAELGGLTKPAKVFPERRHPLSHELTPAVLAYFEATCGRHGRVPLDSKISANFLGRFELMSTVLNHRPALEHFVLGDSEGIPCLFYETNRIDILRIQRGMVMIEESFSGTSRPFTC